MKRVIIFFIIMVSILTFALTRTKEVDKSNNVSNEVINQYKEEIIADVDKNELTEEEENKIVESIIQMETEFAKTEDKGMKFGKALKTSLIISAIVCLVLFLIISLTKAHYREFFNMPYSNDYELYKRKVEYDASNRIMKFFTNLFNK